MAEPKRLAGSLLQTWARDERYTLTGRNEVFIMGVVKGLLFLVGAILAVAMLGAGCAMQGYSRAVSYNDDVTTQWGEVETPLKRRYEIVDELQQAVKGTANQEQKYFDRVAEARTKYDQGSKSARVSQKATLASELEPGVSASVTRLLLLRVDYPALKTNKRFEKLRDDLEQNEKQLLTEAARYNETVRRFNTFSRQYPGKFFAELAKIETARYYEATEPVKAPPQVDFTNLK